MKTAVLYARFSSSKQREASIKDQLRICRKWCKDHNYKVIAEYKDSAISGRTDDRPEFQKMIANAGESDIVLVYMMDRFSRSEYDAPVYKRQLALSGVKLISATEQIPDSPEGIIYEKLLEGLAACESRKIGVRTKRGMEGNALECKTNGVKIFGYRKTEDDHYEIDPVEADFVKEAFLRRLRHESINSIAKDFASRGVKTYTGKPCSFSMIHTMLQNRKYTGRYEWNNIIKEGGMPQIIDNATFIKTQQVRGSKMRIHENWGDYSLSGKITCAKCDHNLHGVSGRGNKNIKYEYYKCPNGCIKTIRKDELEKLIVDSIRKILNNKQQALNIAKKITNYLDTAYIKEKRIKAKHALNDINSAIDNIIKAIEQGITNNSLKERLTELETQKARVLLDLEAIKEDEIDPKCFAKFLQDSIYLNDSKVLNIFVDHVIIDDNEIIVSLNYHENENEPARLNIKRVRETSDWLPIYSTSRIKICILDNLLLFKISLAS